MLEVNDIMLPFSVEATWHDVMLTEKKQVSIQEKGNCRSGWGKTMAEKIFMWQLNHDTKLLRYRQITTLIYMIYFRLWMNSSGLILSCLRNSKRQGSML